MNKIHLVLLITSILSPVIELESSRVSMAPSDMVHICGKALSNLLQIVCESNYNTYPPNIIKRSAPPLNIFKTPQDARSFVTFRRRRKRGVTDECCKKPCKFEELKTYCA